MLTTFFSLRKTGFFLSLLLLINSCKDPLWNVSEVEFEGWEPLLALPLIHSNLTMEDLLKNSDSNVVTIDNEKFITLVYNEHVKSFLASDIITLDDKFQPVNVNLTNSEISTLTGSGSINFSRTVTINFDLDGDAVADEIFFKGGNLKFEVTSQLQHDVQVEMTIPSATKNGLPMKENLQMNYSNGPVYNVKNVSLSEYLFDLDFNDPSKENEFDIVLNFTVNYKNNPVATTDVVDVNFSFQQMDIKYFYGYVGNEILDPIADKIEVPLFTNEIGSTSFKIVDPRVSLIVKNGFGVPSEFNIGHLTFIDQQQNIPLQGSGVPAVFAVNAPDFNQKGQKITSTLYLDKNNSNIDQILAATPDEFSFQVTPKVNPAGVKVRNFVLDDVGMDVDFKLELPLFGSAKNFKLQDTLEFSLDSPDQLLSLMLRSNIKNGFPLDLEMQVYLVDENYNIIDSLLKNDRIIVASAQVNNATSKVDAPTTKQTDIVFSDEMMSKLSQVRYLLVTGMVSTTDQGNKDVKIYSDYALEVKIGVLAKIKGSL